MQDARFPSAFGLHLAIPVLLAIFIAACGGGGSSGGSESSGGSGSSGGGNSNPPPVPTVNVRATVTGLNGDGLHLQLNGGADLEVNADGPHSFATTLRRGDFYTVTVAAVPGNPVQRCLVEAPRGTADADVDVQVRCADAGPSSLLVGSYVETSNPATGRITLYTPGESSDVFTPVAYYSRPYLVQLDRLVDIAGDRYWYTVLTTTWNTDVYRWAVTGIRLDPRFVGSDVPGAPYSLASTDTSGAWRSMHLVSVHPTHRFLYVAGLYVPGLWAFSIDQQTGALASVAGSPMLVEDPDEQLTYFAIHPNGKLALAAFYRWDEQPGRIRSYSIDQVTGALTLVATLVHPMPIARPDESASAIESIARRWEFMTADGRYAHFSLHGSGGNALLTVAMNGATGALSIPANGQVVTPGPATRLARHPFAPFQFYSAASGILIYRMDDSSGVLSLIGEVAGEPRSGAVFDPTGKFLYTAIPDNEFVAYAVDARTGQLTAAPKRGTDAEFAGNIPRWSLDPSGRHLFALTFRTSPTTGMQERVVHILNIDRDTGQLARSPYSPLMTPATTYQVLPLEMPDAL